MRANSTRKVPRAQLRIDRQEVGGGQKTSNSRDPQVPTSFVNYGTARKLFRKKLDQKIAVKAETILRGKPGNDLPINAELSTLPGLQTEVLSIDVESDRRIKEGECACFVACE